MEQSPTLINVSVVYLLYDLCQVSGFHLLKVTVMLLEYRLLRHQSLQSIEYLNVFFNNNVTNFKALKHYRVKVIRIREEIVKFLH